MNSAGRAVLFAGTTVVIALLGMFLLGVNFLDGMAIAASLGVLAVLAASLTLLPALLSITGVRVGRTRTRARTRDGAHGPHEAGFWARWVGAIQRRPVLAAVAATLLMLTLAAPVLGSAVRQQRRGQRPGGTDQPPGLRPARPGIRAGLQRAAAARRTTPRPRPDRRTDPL